MTTTAKRRALVAGLLAVAALLVSACADEQAVTSGGTPAVPPGGAAAPTLKLTNPPPNKRGDGVAPLPTLPSTRARSPELYDERGCVRTAPGEAACSSTAAQQDLAAAGARTDDWRRLAGFEGRGFTTDVTRGQVIVLESTVRTSASGPWRAAGLVRNERDEDLGGVTVTAELVGADGRVIGTVSGDSPVTSVRAGEPVPFVLRADVDAASVASVRWSATASTSAPAPDTAARSVALATYWTRSPSTGRPVELYLYRDGPGELPYLLFGSVESVAPTPMRQPRVVLAWMDREGRVVGVTDTPLVTADGAPAAELAPGESLDFLAVVNDPVLVAAAEASAPMLWGVAG